MNDRSDIDRVLRHWFEDGPTAMPDRVVDVVAHRISVRPQRRSWRLLGRSSMSPMLKWGAAAVAVLVIAVVGYNLLPGSGVGTPRPTATPSPTTAPTPSRAPGLLVPGALAPGTYITQPFEGSGFSTAVTFALPAGWSGFPNWGLLGPEGTGASGGIGIGFLTADGLFSDPCHWDSKRDGSWPQRGDIVVGPSVDDLVAALGAHASYTATAPTAVTLNGYAGKKIDLQLPSSVDLAKCDPVGANPDGAYFVWGTADQGGNDLYLQGPGQRWQLWILDVAGHRVVIVVDDYANTSEQDRTAAQSIVDSVRFTP